jgi:hypothetical protein
MEKVEFADGTYAMLWSAILKTGDKDVLVLFKKSLQSSKVPVWHHKIEKNLLTYLLTVIQKNNVRCDIDKILHNCNSEGYYEEHYTFKSGKHPNDPEKCNDV